MTEKSFLSRTAIAQSLSVQLLLPLTAAITVAILLWTRQLAQSGHLSSNPIYYLLFVIEDHAGATGMLIVLLLALLTPASARSREIIRQAGENPLKVCGAVTFVLMLAAIFVYQNHPLSMDEYTAYFQGQIFANGRLTGNWPQDRMDWIIPPGFQNGFINVSHVTGRTISGYWPSFSLLLAPFALISAPWACNPVLTGLTLLTIHRLALEIFKDTEAAGMAMLLTAASPVIFAYGISYYAMQAHLLTNCVYALLLLRPTPRRAFLAGIVGSIALTLHNPVPHILFCLPWLAWLATRPRGIAMLLAAGAGYLPLCALLGLGWHWFSGQVIHEGLNGAEVAIRMTGNQQNVSLIFHFPTAQVLELRLIDLAKLWTWAVPGIPILAGIGAWRWRGTPSCLLLAASAFITFAGYLFFPFDQGHGWGARYLHSAWLALPLLATAAMFRPAPAASEPRSSGLTEAQPNTFEDLATRTYAATCIVAAFVFCVGLRALQMHDFISLQLSQLPHYGGTERRVVFLDYKGQLNIRELFTGYYAGDLIQNDPWLRRPATIMFSHGAAEDVAMMARDYPGFHPVYADNHGVVWSETPATMRPAPAHR